MQEIPRAAGTGTGAAEFPVQAGNEPHEQHAVTGHKSGHDGLRSDPTRSGPGEEAGGGITNGESGDDGFVILQRIQVIRDDEDAGDQHHESGDGGLMYEVSRQGIIKKPAACAQTEHGSEGERAITSRENAVGGLCEKAVGRVAGEHQLQWPYQDKGKGVNMRNGRGEKFQCLFFQQRAQKKRQDQQSENGNDPRAAADDGGETIGAQDSLHVLMP